MFAGSRADSITYLSGLVGNPALPSLHPMHPGRNPASWLLHVTQPLQRSASSASSSSGESSHKPTHAELVTSTGSAFQACFRESRHFSALSSDLVFSDEVSSSSSSSSSSSVSRSGAFPGAHSGFLKQIGQIMLRQLRAQWRNAESVAGRLGGLIIVCFIFGLVHLRLDSSGVAGTQTLVGLLVNVAGIVSVIPAQVALATLYNERATAARELAAGIYSPLSMCVATVCAEALSLLVCLPGPSAMLYFMSGLRPEVFGVFLGTIGMLAIWFLAMVIASAVVAPTLASAQTLLVFALLLASLFSGLFVPASNIVKELRWLHDINPLGFAAEAVVASQVHADGVNIDVLVPGVGNSTGSVMLVTMPRETFVEEVFNFTHGEEGADVGYIALWTLGLLIAYVIAAHKVKLSSR